jgi:hypothetical protein
MVFGKVQLLSNNTTIGVTRAPGGVGTAPAFVCVVPLPLRTAAPRLVRSWQIQPFRTLL